MNSETPNVAAVGGFRHIQLGDLETNLAAVQLTAPGNLI